MKRYLIIISMLISSTVAASTSVKVVTEDLWPFNYIENNEIKGSATLFVKHLLNEAHIDYTLTALPWARSYKLATTDANVLIYTINKTPSRLNKFHWITDLSSQVDTNYYALTSNDNVSRNIRDLKVGTLIDSVNDAFLKQHAFKHVTRVSHLKQSVSMLKWGRIDLIISSENALKKALEESDMAFENITNIGTAFSSQPAIAMSLSTPLSTVEKLRKVAHQLNQSHSTCRIMEIEEKQCVH